MAITVSSKISSNISALHPYSCRYNCSARKWCSAINQNLAKAHCLLSVGPCMYLVPDNDFQVIYVKPSKTERCLVWKLNRESSNPARAHNACITEGIPCIIGWFLEELHLLPENFANWGLLSVFNNNIIGMVSSSGAQSLDVQPGCMVNWMPFIGGEPLPEGAVEGGYLDDGGVRQPLYIMSVDVVFRGGTCSVYGYYNLATGLGFAEFHNEHVRAHINLMILWDWVTRKTFELDWHSHMQKHNESTHERNGNIRTLLLCWSRDQTCIQRAIKLGGHLAQAMISKSDHSMMTSSNGNIFMLLALCMGQSTGQRWISNGRTNTWDADDLRRHRTYNDIIVMRLVVIT